MPDRSPDRALMDRIHRLRSRQERERTGLFYVEGIRFVAEALASGAVIETVVFSRQLLPPSGHRVLNRCLSARIPAQEIGGADFLGLSVALEAQGIGAVVRQRWVKLRDVRPTPADCWVAHETIQSPGNLGTILRTSDAAGGRGAILLGGQVDPHDSAVVRATMGALFHQTLVRSGMAELREWSRRNRVRIVGASPHAKLDYREACYGGPLVLLMGSERKGLTTEQEAICDELVRIPMIGRSDSLNLGVAAGLLLYEVYRQRNPLPPSLPAKRRGRG